MSCDTPTSIGRSRSRSLSPSDESRFVPHSSVVDASDVMEKHFAASTGTVGAEKSHSKVEDAAAAKEATDNITSQDSGKGPSLLAVEKMSGGAGTPIKRSAFAPPPSRMGTLQITDNIESQAKSSFSSNESREVSSQKSTQTPTKSGIVGTTICCTPEPSPRSFHKAGKSTLDSIDANMNDYIGSINAVSSGDSAMEGLASRMSSSAMQVASSLDGRSITEYEMLDGISSKGTIEVEDLILEGEDDEEHGSGGDKKEEVKSCFNEATAAALLENLSPTSTLPSIETRRYKTEDDSSSFCTDENSLAPRTLIDDPLQMLKNSHEKASQTSLEHVSDKASQTEERSQGLKLDSDDVQAKGQESSPKIDQSPLSPFKSLHKYWEGQATLSDMTKSVIGRILHHETSNSANLAATKGAQTDIGDIPEEIKVVGSVNKPSGTDEDGSIGKKSGIVEATPKNNTFASPLYKGLISAVSYIASLADFIGVLLLGPISALISNTKATFVRLIHKLIARKSIPIEADDAPQVTTSGSKEDALEHKSTDLSKLFLDEAMAAGTGKQAENSSTLTSVEQPEKALFTRIKDEITARIMTKCKQSFSVLTSVRARYAVVPAMLILMLLVFMNGTHQVNENDLHQDISDTGLNLEKDDIHCDATNLNISTETQDVLLLPVLGEEEDESLCAVTNMASLESVPLWELNLSPTLFDLECPGEQGPDDSGSRPWLITILASTIITSFFCALLYKSKRTKAQAITKGIWTEEEHQQFVEGYNEHGKRWKLVSSFVPTRTDTQVRSHGQYWLKIRSPEKMKKSRKSMDATPKANKTRNPQTPRSASSNKSTPTPKKSNKTKPTPLKGILIEQDSNQKFKNVTPRSEARTRARKMREKQGSKSDPGKRVRIQAP